MTVWTKKTSHMSPTDSSTRQNTDRKGDHQSRTGPDSASKIVEFAS
jgi:hypothetical protein